MTAPKPSLYVTNDPYYMENGYTLYLRDGGPCWIIDPGLPPQGARIIAHVREHRLTPERIVLTHAHADHIGGLDEVCEAFPGVPVHLAREEWAALTDPMENLSGLFGPGLVTRCTDPKDLPHEGTLTLDGTTWRALDVSGHSPGGRGLYCAELGMVIVGDALFLDSVGRVDFPHSNGEQLMRNIHANLMTLPDDTTVYSGHGPQTTIGRERRQNPYVVHGL